MFKSPETLLKFLKQRKIVHLVADTIHSPLNYKLCKGKLYCRSSFKKWPNAKWVPSSHDIYSLFNNIHIGNFINKGRT